VSNSDAPNNAPGVLDSEWTAVLTGSYTSDGTTAQIVIAAADVESAVTDAGFAPVAGSFSTYVWNVDVVDPTIRDADFTGDVTINAITVSWTNNVDSSLTGGYIDPSTGMDVPHWTWCTAATMLGMGETCESVTGIVGINTWAWIDAMGMNQQKDTFSPWGEVVFSEVPEPKPVLLMGLGLGGLAILSQRRRRVL
jgi:hypothetical protein